MSQKIVLLFVFASFLALTMGQIKEFPPQPAPSTSSTTTTPSTPPTTPTTPPTTSTTPPTTTTTPPTTTTQPKPTTTPGANTTTAPPPTTTPVPSTTPVPTPTPEPELGDWTVFDAATNTTCIIAEMAIQLNISYERTDINKTGYAVINIPANHTKATGECGNLTQTLTLAWLPTGVVDMSNSIVLTFSKNDSTKLVKVDRIDVVIQANVTEFVGIANFTTMTLVNNQSQFATSLGMSYLCSKVQALNLTTGKTNTTIAVIDVSHLRVEAFHKGKEAKFSSAKDCEPSNSTDLVPIFVGCGLVLLVAIVLIAYLVGRRRSQARGYLSIDDQGS